MTHKLVPIEQHKLGNCFECGNALSVYCSYCNTPEAAPKPSIPADDRMAAIRAGCSAADIHLKCSYPDCSCETTPREIDAAISILQRLGWKT